MFQWPYWTYMVRQNCSEAISAYFLLIFSIPNGIKFTGFFFNSNCICLIIHFLTSIYIFPPISISFLPFFLVSSSTLWHSIVNQSGCLPGPKFSKLCLTLIMTIQRSSKASIPASHCSFTLAVQRIRWLSERRYLSTFVFHGRPICTMPCTANNWTALQTLIKL